MLTKMTIRNFKRFEEVDIDLGSPVIFIGPNDSGKTTALQALVLWEIGLKRWKEKRGNKGRPEKRPGVSINRKDIIASPVPNARLIWRDLNVRSVERTETGQQTKNIRIDIIVEGVTGGKNWKCGLEFDYANEESIYCRPLRLSEDKNPERMLIPAEAYDVNVAFLPPMSGLSSNEIRLDMGAIAVRLGEGRTAEVLRNLCYKAWDEEEGGNSKSWSDLCEKIKHLFGAELETPKYLPERGEITMNYKDRYGSSLDLSCSGRGMQQTLLILAYLAANKGAALLLDEPDAHLEILRQRQIYRMLSETAYQWDSQIVAASHSEVVLNEAADRDVVVAFLGKPHRIDERGTQLRKSLTDIGYEQYYQAEQRGWVLYLEGSTDLAILNEFAELLEHPVLKYLESPFVHYVENKPSKARDHFHGLKAAKKDLKGYALFDHLEEDLREDPYIVQYMWSRREIKNYFCQRETLLRWAEHEGKKHAGHIFSATWVKCMEKCVEEIESALETLEKDSPWSSDVKVSDDFLNPLFDKFFKRINLPNLMEKSNYHQLAKHVSSKNLDPEIAKVLDQILEVAESAQPV